MLFKIRFMFVFCFVFCVFSVYVLLYYCFVYYFSFCDVSFLFLYQSTDQCHRVETQLQ
jgi:hypothetical protein